MDMFIKQRYSESYMKWILTKSALTRPQRMPNSEHPITKPKAKVSSIIALELIY